jgi:hypothetical protein
MLPAYCKNDPKWLVRLLIDSIGCACLIFQKMREIKGSSAGYPSPITRLVSNIRFGISEIYMIDTNWINTDSQFLIDTIGNVVSDVYVASEMLNEELDAFDPRSEYFADKKEPKILDLISDTSEAVGLIYGIATTYVNDDQSLFRKLDDGIYNKYFAELEEIVKFQETTVFDELYKFRKLTSSGKTFYGEP